MAGRFITLEGGEGVGKSTQIRRLAEALAARGHTVVTTREPGGTEGAEAIRGLLLSGGQDRWNDATEALLFAAARADHVAKLIRPSIAAGSWVLCDRFVDSTRAYQGGAGGVSDADILDLHRVGSGGLLPDRTIVLDLPVDEGTRRAAARSAETDRMGAKSTDYYERVAARFRELAAQEPGRFRVTDASGSPEEVTARILDALADLL
ncbi:dTMP kinase [Chakrabartia godavariana]|nr:dTMP kinase [Chakrabartia godavariana]